MKKFVVYGFFTILVLIVAIAWSSLSLVKLDNRPNSYSPSSELKAEIKAETKWMTAEEIRVTRRQF